MRGGPKRWRLWLGTALVLASSAAWAGSPAPTVVRYRPPEGPNDARYHYFVGMLELALRKTRGDFGDYRLQAGTMAISQERAFDLVQRGRYLNLVWGMTSKRREAQARAVRIPLLKGLLGYRVLLVRPEEAARFSRIEGRQALARYRCVQGAGWPDTAILRANGLRVLTSTDYDGMFGMLLRGRVAYFPRSVAEVWAELARFSSHQLTISRSPLLVYRGPIYFFVNRKDKTLAKRLRVGLERAIADGSFERQFLKRSEIRRAVALLRHGHYRVIALRNPDLPADTPLHDARLWFHAPRIDAALSKVPGGDPDRGAVRTATRP